MIYLIQMTGEIEVHEPPHIHNAGHVSEQYVGILPKRVYSLQKKIHCKWNEWMCSKVIHDFCSSQPVFQSREACRV